MEFNLAPMKSTQKLADEEGGAYYEWSSSEFPLLRETQLGAGKLVLRPGGLALPHYADSSKIGYVLEGNYGIVGLVFPNTSEKVIVKLEKGDVIPVPVGTISWWFNGSEGCELTIVFLGQTSAAASPGQFTYSFLTGKLGILGGFSTELITKAYSLSEDKAHRLTKSQTSLLITKVDKGKEMPVPVDAMTRKLVYNIDSAKPFTSVNEGGSFTLLTEKEFSFIGEVGLSAARVKLEANAMMLPIFYAGNSGTQLIYVAKGGGKIEIVGNSGKSALNVEVKEGELLFVPKFFVLSEIAGKEGMECISIITTNKPVFEGLAGKSSLWESLSYEVLLASLNVDEDLVKEFLTKMAKTPTLIHLPKD